MTRMAALEPGGKALVDCPLDDANPQPKVVVASCGGTRSVMWSNGAAGETATSYFDVSGKLSAYQESSESPAGYTCGDGRTARVAVYGSVPTCQPWTEQRYCSSSAARAGSR
jgi:beta-lactamase superfamily II metal-dependent hydrolase